MLTTKRYARSVAGPPSPAVRGGEPKQARAAAAGIPRFLQRKCAPCEEEEQKRLQPKLSVGELGDPLEREADRVADAVLGGPAEAARTATSSVQRRAEQDAHGEPAPALDVVEDALRSGGAPLDPTARAYFEPRFGQDFGDVRVLNDARAAEACRSIGAEAFTVGNKIAFKRQSPPDRLVAHELAHVVQQGAAAPARQIQRWPEFLDDLLSNKPEKPLCFLSDCPDLDEKTKLWAYPPAASYILSHYQGLNKTPQILSMTTLRVPSMHGMLEMDINFKVVPSHTAEEVTNDPQAIVDELENAPWQHAKVTVTFGLISTESYNLTASIVADLDGEDVFFTLQEATVRLYRDDSGNCYSRFGAGPEPEKRKREKPIRPPDDPRRPPKNEVV